MGYGIFSVYNYTVMAFILFFLQINKKPRFVSTQMIVFGSVLRIIVFERSLFDFIYILRIGFEGGLSFRNNEN